VYQQLNDPPLIQNRKPKPFTVADESIHVASAERGHHATQSHHPGNSIGLSAAREY
jgi:hypothetical protein